MLLYNFPDTDKSSRQIVMYFHNHRGDEFVTPYWSSEEVYTKSRGDWYGYGRKNVIEEFPVEDFEEFRKIYPEYLI